MQIVDRIQQLRKQRGFSQEELADKIGVSRQAVSKWESGQSTPDLDKVVAMSDLFCVTTDYIIKGVQPPLLFGKKAAGDLYRGFAAAFAVVAGIWAFAANRFRWDECLWIALGGGAIGFGVALVVQVIGNIIVANKGK